MIKPLEIFISSAIKDEKFLGALLKALKGSLKPLEQQGLISFWHEHDIKPGANIKHEIQTHLQSARIFLLLISADFMNLSFCDSKEMHDLLRRHQEGEIVIIPILIRPAVWETAPFGELQPLPDNRQAVSSWGNRDKAFLNIAIGVRKIVDGILSPTAAAGDNQSTRAKPSSSFTSEKPGTAQKEFTLISSASEQTYSGVANYWAIVVGVGEYEDTSYPPLPTCTEDAKAVAKQLTSCGYYPAHMRLLIDKRGRQEDLLIEELTGEQGKLNKPTKGNIIEALQTMAQRTRPEDLLLFYYTGHGSMKDRESYLVARDGRKNTLEHTAVPITILKKIMHQAPAQKKVIILDTCRTETSPSSKGTPRPMPPAFIERVFEQAKGLVILTSCNAGENSYVWEEKNCSVFTYFFLQGLQNGNADFNGKDRISAKDIHNYVLHKVRRWALLNNYSQTPHLTTDEGQGEIVIAYYQQEPATPALASPNDRTASILPSRIGAPSWRDMQTITIQGETYLFEPSTVRELPTGDDGAILREARVRHMGTDLPLWLKQAHMLGPDRDGAILQNILKKEQQILIDLEAEGHHHFPRVFPLIDGNAEKDFLFAYIATNEKNVLQTLGGAKEPRDPSSIKWLLQSIFPVCEALSVLHQKNLSHRALSLDTLLLLKERYVILQDIGLAAWKPRKGENRDQHFLAPEQEKHNTDIVVLPGPATDIYQLGVILYLLVTGRTFTPGSLPGFHNQAVSSQLNAAISRAVTRQPTERWPSIEAFSTALRESI